ncbi:endonuclease/exonuclease/phosphatase family protein [Snodgrassella sp. CFCC 13594]|uniref:endonuclease/exonuclease/phosphatase family protein n=1 Tax=Snodgrassella sp. CFCC 13594 TaxID=1775559 RepID=UPI000831E2C8|nr:endonuclease/exonuclease/phosphatase family protein [Snodgrassella sp. CFCC 13594]
MSSALTIATYNMHKGMSPLNQQVKLDQMAAALKGLSPDVLFLQEVQGQNLKRAQQLPNFPRQPHYQILSEALDCEASYGKNAQYKLRDHGNAILSNLPIITRNNLNITVNQMEQRGVLHCEIQPESWSLPLVCLCAHLNLREPDREKQYQAIYEYINTHINPDSPLILAGDFNDWRRRSCENLGENLGLQEAFACQGNMPKTFPARLPILSLDRVYTRHLDVLAAKSMRGLPWQSLSDHLPLLVKVQPERKIIKQPQNKSQSH